MRARAEGVQRSEWPQRAENASSLPLPLALPGGMSAPLANGSLKCASLSARYPAPSSEITPWYIQLPTVHIHYMHSAHTGAPLEGSTSTPTRTRILRIRI